MPPHNTQKAIATELGNMSYHLWLCKIRIDELTIVWSYKSALISCLEKIRETTKLKLTTYDTAC